MSRSVAATVSILWKYSVFHVLMRTAGVGRIWFVAAEYYDAKWTVVIVLLYHTICNGICWIKVRRCPKQIQR